jgi:phosphodiesterase/alkaline phosphatase D-like protein
MVPTTNIRFASFNASLNRNAAGELINDLSTPNNNQARTVAEIIQRVNPDVLLINEFDFYDNAQAATLFQQNYLSVSQNGVPGVQYPYFYVAPSNTGVASGFDLDNNGAIVNTPGANGYANDALGFGNFPGQFGMVVYSKYPIVENQVRTFRNFLWKDMPGALLPDDLNTAAANDWYSTAELDVFRLSSKSHWDIPINVNGEIVHALVSHPTPPVFDGTEDRNGKRNHDEIRFWADYITPGQNNYIYDDAGNFGGLNAGESFVIMGDQNADPFDGDSTNNAIRQILDKPSVNTSVTPTSEGAIDATIRQGGVNANHLGNPAFDTADFADNSSGNLRADYVLPSSNLEINNSAVFWPPSNDPNFRLVGDFPFPSSDHRLVWADINVKSFPNGVASGDVTQNSAILWTRSEVLGNVTFEYGTDPNFNNIVGSKIAAVSDINLPVKVEITGLNPNTEYFYRVTDAGTGSAIGRLKTSAQLGTQAGLRFGVAGDWRGEISPYPAISNVPSRNLSFFVEHGDTIYADFPSDAVLNPDGGRKQQAQSVAEYRAKHNEVYSDRFGLNTWEKLRASTSILATIDDHEVINDFSGGASAANDPRFPEGTGFINDTQLYENGLQAFQEYNPLRNETYGNTGDDRTANEAKLYRYNTYGSDAAVVVLDNRSFRDAPLTEANINDTADVARFLSESLTQNRTMLGQVQLETLKQDLLSAQLGGITWKFVMVPEPIQNFGPGFAEDRFEGYAKERTEILSFIKENQIDNVVFVAADIHGTVVNNLTYQKVPGGEQIPTNAFEISTGSVAFSPPFGPVVANLFTANNPNLQAVYNSLPVANDRDSTVNDKDDFLKQLLNQGLTPVGYDPVGLNDNLAVANGLIDASLVQGDYLATHTYGWTEFNTDPVTQQLRVTTYGIEPYSEPELLANPNAIISRTPEIVSEFVVNPIVPFEVVFGTTGNDNLDAGNPQDNFDGAKDIVFTGTGADLVSLSTSSFSGQGESRIYTGSGNDEVLPGKKDRAFGNEGDDIIDASLGSGGNRLDGGVGDDEIIALTNDNTFGGQGNDIIDASLGSGGNRLYGGLGNDRFFLGSSDRVVGGEGDDTFFVGEGSNNIITGGQGVDTFWVVTGSLPNSANTITDFELGVDAIAIGGFAQSDLSFAQDGDNAILSVGTSPVAIFAGISQNQLQSATFIFS